MDDLILKLYQQFKPEDGLEADDSRYVNFSEVRGTRFLFRNLFRPIEAEAGTQRSTYQLICGQPGSGKTTELKRFQRWIMEQIVSPKPKKKRFFSIRVDTDEYINTGDVEYDDILFAIISALVEQVWEVEN